MQSTRTVSERLQKIEARLEVIEGRLGLAQTTEEPGAAVIRELLAAGAEPGMAPAASTAEPVAPVSGAPGAPAAPERLAATPPTVPPLLRPTELPEPAASSRPRAAGTGRAVGRSAPERSMPERRTPEPRTPERARGKSPTPPPLPPLSAPAAALPAPAATAVAGRAPERGGRFLEQLIGGRVFGALGAIVVVIGIGLLLKYGFDRGWFAMPPQAKCLLAAGFGAALVAAGEVVRRKVNALASAGVSAAGIGAIYASAWAARVRYELVGDEVAFVLLAATTVLGVVIALRARLLSVAVLSILGAYLAPFIVRAESPSPAVLPVYSLALLALGLVLSSWRGQPFRPLRSVTWWGTVAVGTLWTVMHAREHPVMAGAFYLAFWLAVHAEMFISARRDEGRIFATEEEEDAAARPATPAGPGYRAVLTSFGTTVWSVGLGTIVMRSPVAPVDDWFVTAGGFVAALCVGLMVAGNLRLIRDVPRTTAQRLGAGLMMQAGALLIATVALGLKGETEAAAWLAMGVAAVGAGRWLRARALDAYGLVVLVIGSARLVVFDSWAAGAATPVGTSGGFVLSWWMGLMVCGAAAWIGSAVLMLVGARERGAWRRVSVAATAVGVAMLFGSLLHEQVEAAWLAWAWLVLSVVVALASRTEGRLRLEWMGAAGLVATGAAWLVAYPARVESMVGGFVMGMALWGVAIAGARWLRTRARVVSSALPVYGAIVLLLTSVRLIWIGPGGASVEVAGIVLTTWTVLMVIAAAAWLGSARLLLSRVDERWHEEWGWLATGAAAAGVGLVFGSLAHQDVSVSSLAWAWLGLSVVTALARVVARRLRLEWIGLAGALPAATAWVIAYPLTEWADRTGLFHPGFVFGAALIGVCVFLTRWAARGARNEEVRRYTPFAGAGVGIALLLLITSMEVMRGAQILTADEMVRASALSIWWGLFGVAMVAAGFARRVAPCRHTGLGLILVATTKAVIVDFADVPELWRIASFVGLGLLMLGVAVAYFRLAAVLEGGGRRLPSS